MTKPMVSRQQGRSLAVGRRAFIFARILVALAMGVAIALGLSFALGVLHPHRGESHPPEGVPSALSRT